MDQTFSTLLFEAVNLFRFLQQNQMLAMTAQDALGEERNLDKAAVLLQSYLDSTYEQFEELDSILSQCHKQTKRIDLAARAQRHRPLLQAIPAVAVTLNDASSDARFNEYPYLDCYAVIPERLNKPREELIGKPVTVVSPAIAEPRLHYIKRALANAQCERYSYEYQDEFLWKFNVTIAPIYGTDEIITIVQDAEPWQAGYWLNRREKES